MPFWILLGTLFGMLTGVRGQEIRFCLPSLSLPGSFLCQRCPFGRPFCAKGAFLDVFECIFGRLPPLHSRLPRRYLPYDHRARPVTFDMRMTQISRDNSRLESLSVAPYDHVYV